MTIAQLEVVRDSIKAQLETLLKNPCAPGQEVMRCCNEIELRAAVRTVDQIIMQERMTLTKPPGATGPVLVGV